MPEAIKLDPDNAQAYCHRGVLLREKRQDFAPALNDFTEAVRFDPQYTRAYYNRGLVYLMQNNPDAAIADFNAAIEIDPQYGNAYLGRSKAYEKKGDHAQCRRRPDAEGERISRGKDENGMYEG